VASRAPAYTVLSDATLREMAATRPTSDEAMLAVNGVGEHKLRTFGALFLDVLRTFDLSAP
jgi:ATP-dependent DNA helicase RecQ